MSSILTKTIPHQFRNRFLRDGSGSFSGGTVSNPTTGAGGLPYTLDSDGNYVVAKKTTFQEDLVSEGNVIGVDVLVSEFSLKQLTDLFEYQTDSEGNITALGVKVDLYSNHGLSSLGYGDGSGSSGGGLIGTVYDYNALGGSFNNSTLTDAFNAYTTNQLYLRLLSLETNTPLSFVSSGSGNVVTGVSKSGNTVTVTKGLTVLTDSDLSGYVTTSQLNTALASYVTNSVLNSTLSGYVTTSVLSSTLADYVTNSVLTSALSGYLTTSDNAASATKLATARTIWGQSFNGSANVSGALSGATTISATGEIQSSSANAFRLSYGNYGVIHRNDGVTYYMLLTDSGSATSGGWNSLRPFLINLSTGAVGISTPLTTGNVTHNGTLTTTGAVSFNSTLNVTGIATFASTAKATDFIISSTSWSLKKFSDLIEYQTDSSGNITAIGFKVDLYSLLGISALGYGSSSGSGGSGIVQSVYAYGDLGSTFSNTTLTDTFNAYTINQINSRVASLEANTPLTFTTSGSGNVVTAISKSANTVTVTKGLTALLSTDTLPLTLTETGTGNAVTSISKSGNVITFTKGSTFALSSALGSYLPLTGGTLTGALTGTTINATSASSYAYGFFSIRSGYSWRAAIGVSSGTNAVLLNSQNLDGSTEYAYIRLSPTVLQYGIVGVADYNIYHTGNANLSTVSWSMLNATVAGTLSVAGAITGASTIQGTRLISTVATGTAPLTVSSTTLVPNLYVARAANLYTQGRLTAIADGARPSNTGLTMYEVYSNGYPTTYGNLIQVMGASSNGAGELLLGWSGTTGGVANVYYRSLRDVNSTTWSAWKQLAFTDSDITGNAASATKLATSRTIWGQSFDGTSDITSMLTVGNNTFTGGLPLRFLSVNGGWAFYNIQDSVYLGDLRIEPLSSTGTWLRNSLTLQASTGYVGIKNTKPQYPLDVAGALRATGAVSFASTLAVAGVATLPKILLNCFENASSGISFYSQSYNSWQIYMANTTVTTAGTNGNVAPPKGQFVTSWGLRSVIEPNAGFGWTWESMANTGTTPSIVAELSSVNGNFKTTGEIQSSSANAFRLSYGNYGVIHRNDGGSYYILLTDSGSAVSGNWNSLRPLRIDLATGSMYIGTALSVTGAITATSTITANSSIVSPYTGSSWLSMATRTNQILGNQANSASSAHSLYMLKNSNGDAISYGGLGVNIGFYGFTASRIAAGTNGTDWSTYWNVSNGSISHSGALAVGGAVSFSSTLSVTGAISSTNRIYTGYDSTVTNSISCSNWFRSNGATGWYNASYAGGIYMTDTTYVRVYGAKAFYVASTTDSGLYSSGVQGSIVTLGGIQAAKSIYAGSDIVSEAGITALATSTSDMRLKNDFGSMDKAVRDMLLLPVFSFSWNDKAQAWNKHLTNDLRHYGTSAQAVKEILPDFVKEVNGYYVVQYEKFIPLLLGAVKIHDITMRSFDTRLSRLERENKELKERIKALENGH